MLNHARGELANVTRIEFRAATEQEVLEFHSARFVNALRERDSASVDSGLLAVGAVRELSRRVMSGQLSNGYALVRPAGHHAMSVSTGGGCVFANGVLAALELKKLGARRILLVDWDAHHGNSQQEAFWTDPSVLTISVHQARAFAPGMGGTDARGAGDGHGANINIPVPPGSGGGVYRTAFADVIAPAAAIFRPDAVLVSSGLDANYIDPSARLCLHSGDFGWMATQVRMIANRYAHGRLLMTHEGGYALSYLPLCFLRIVEAISGSRTTVPDPFLERWGDTFAAEVPSEARHILDHYARLVHDVPRM